MVPAASRFLWMYYTTESRQRQPQTTVEYVDSGNTAGISVTPCSIMNKTLQRSHNHRFR
ncbi:MAG: hypothetical protein IJD11_00330 [Oscillospiraceae bacterium]|nr:hypothetical protein [Oscillospiraceae bacterium]